MELAVQGSPSLIVNTEMNVTGIRVQELCESGAGRPGLSVPNSPYGLCVRKATLKNKKNLS